MFCFPQASLPLQEYLSMPFERAQKQADVARHLPPPLYVLLVQASAYGQACGKVSSSFKQWQSMKSDVKNSHLAGAFSSAMDICTQDFAHDIQLENNLFLS